MMKVFTLKKVLDLRNHTLSFNTPLRILIAGLIFLPLFQKAAFAETDNALFVWENLFFLLEACSLTQWNKQEYLFISENSTSSSHKPVAALYLDLRGILPAVFADTYGKEIDLENRLPSLIRTNIQHYQVITILSKETFTGLRTPFGSKVRTELRCSQDFIIFKVSTKNWLEEDYSTSFYGAVSTKQNKL